MAMTVAGKIGATILKRARLTLSPTSSPSSLSLFNPTPPPHRSSRLPLFFPAPTAIFVSPSRLLRRRQPISFVVMVAAQPLPPLSDDTQIKASPSKIQKLAHESFSQAPIAALPHLLRVKKLSQAAVLPSRASHLSAGYDLSSAKDIRVPARGKVLIPTDLSIVVPEGTYARIAPRSGLALKHSLDVGAGVVDADYRGPVGVILFNHSDVDFDVKAGDRIAQLILEKIATPDVIEVQDLDSTDRGDGGFGSTGV